MFFSGLTRVSRNTRVPVRALLLQGVWAIILVLSGSYDTLTDYAIFSVLIFVALATSAVFVLRKRWPRDDDVYRTWGYPIVPLVFLVATGWLLINTLVTTPGRALAGLGLMALGLPFYWYWSRDKERATRENAQG
jgi:APA family basic amino acid/polyamine antiporter